MKRGSFILVGDHSLEQEYVDKFIKDEQIPSYNIQEYNENFKIADARQFIKTLSVKIPQGESRLFIIRGDVQHEAQNALLKTLEELDENTTVFFFSTNLLPTIASRSLKVDVGTVNQTSYDSLELDDTSTSAEKLVQLDRFFSEKHPNAYSDLILIVRKTMMDAYSQKNLSKAKFASKLLKQLISYSALVESNNLNPRIIAEKIFLNI